eukprot:CAMPEP_0183301134 /NCGR_PEP_ID=MMETSP0160_2-20130417/7340_1 /TAXON_ID=2839 ORGANISM="Odontella Sinensis, Strain Grunow 1884" /NCGR_SAMPLE_ID=MMETSP0160_2 /ASSEMBLY_ACC=CAM_ASM_000250 /LENGTH=120 /DNA_ID=CAMNT_0025463687 /DNA_START=116 /DNA_END=478 /DNA_ORIENTATION=-
MTFAESVNIARRLSVRNEPDLLQENMFEDNSGNSDSATSHHTHEYCLKIGSILKSVSDLPPDCRVHEDVVRSVKERLAKEQHEPGAKAYEGYGGGGRAQVHQAQVQRRLTHRKHWKDLSK